MAPAVVLIAAIVAVIGVALVLVIRALMAAEERVEARIHDPATPTVAYPVPNGVDPVTVMGALGGAGFANVHERIGTQDCVVIECEPEQREQARRVIEQTHDLVYQGSHLDLGQVRFLDER